MNKPHNLEIARIFFEMADILEMQNVQWKPQAYRRAAKAIDSLREDVGEIYKKYGLKGIKEIPGVGENLAKKIVEFIKTGKIQAYEKLKASIPAHVAELAQIPGIGPKKIKKLYQTLHIKTLKDLERALKQHKVAKLPGFGEKSERSIIESLKMKKEKRRPLKEVLPIANGIIEQLKKSRLVKQISVAGSIRRKKETVRDIDILVTTKNPEKVMDIFTSLPEVSKILAKGPTKSTVILKQGIQADVRVVPEESYGAALMYFTGSKEHNIKIREIAMKKGFKLSEYGLFDRTTGKLVASRTEEEIYNKLGLNYIDPTKRENKGEIEAAMKKK
ncbi:MAG: helix-hairpin-helix domain-containing protein [Candidatus Pacearchaeota archaeon]|nr:helix-hairpin-helix domain-containing protein [Candidatus Pacearchaeota archaeon]